jgi:hypothetical protein
MENTGFAIKPIAQEPSAPGGKGIFDAAKVTARMSRSVSCFLVSLRT